jgi:RNA-binding protein
MIPNQQQTKHLKSLCHGLAPVVRIGQKGVTDAVMTELEIALSHHELIKIKVSVGDRDARKAAIKQMAESSNAVVIQQVGQIAVLFRRNHEKPVIMFPK